MAENEQATDDTTRVVDDPEPGYFQPLKAQRVAERQSSDPKCNYGTCSGESVSECVECRPKVINAPAPAEEPETGKGSSDELARVYELCEAFLEDVRKWRANGPDYYRGIEIAALAVLAVRNAKPAPAPAAESGGGIAESLAFYEHAPGEWRIRGYDKALTKDNCDRIIKLLERCERFGLTKRNPFHEVDELRAQLAKYKRDAEAWEAIMKYGIAVGHGGGMACEDAPIRMMYWIGGNRRTDFASKQEAATRMRFIAAQLASQADQTNGKDGSTR